jgi:Uma2 family endonuclease
MGEPALKVPSFDDLYREIMALPEGVTGEILDPGVLRTMSRPGGGHRSATRRSLRSLSGHDIDEGGLGWWFEIEAEIRFGERLLVPDLSGWRADVRPDFVDENPIPVRPDWVCEILSRTTQRGDRAIKVPRYADEGVGWQWVVDPEARSIEVYETRDRKAVLVASAVGAVTRELPPFAGEIDVGKWWVVKRAET